MKLSYSLEKEKIKRHKNIKKITDYNKCYEGNRVLGEKLTGQLRFSGKGRLLRM